MGRPTDWHTQGLEFDTISVICVLYNYRLFRVSESIFSPSNPAVKNICGSCYRETQCLHIFWLLASPWIKFIPKVSFFFRHLTGKTRIDWFITVIYPDILSLVIQTLGSEVWAKHAARILLEDGDHMRLVLWMVSVPQTAAPWDTCRPPRACCAGGRWRAWAVPRWSPCRRGARTPLVLGIRTRIVSGN